MTQNTCAKCKWWKPIEMTSGEEGECHRRAPAPELYDVPVGQYAVRTILEWPKTRQQDFCGDFYAKGGAGFV